MASRKSTDQPPEKKRKTNEYTLYYWPGVPGRGEHVRLAFEFAGVLYKDIGEPAQITRLTQVSHTAHPPHFAPPALALPSGKLLSQTSNILNLIAPRLGLAGALGSLLAPRSQRVGKAWEEFGEDKERELTDEERVDAEEERAVVNQLVLTALDLNNEAHDTHHPIAVSLYYEDQKEAALAYSASFRAERIPKFLKHFNAVLTSNPKTKNSGAGQTFLVGARTTTADLVLFQVLDGLIYAFPKRMNKLRKDDAYDAVFALHESLRDGPALKGYLDSDRRRPYGMGIFRHYEELDGED
ncbi:hypothetical protein CERSUDRAFT_85364 [Gelatoporia subvermispora B]|uniref:Glutathione S-transferase C-terminal-like protein n=1 Tax=Ceriporiopsis subvermispora (strain B) TaxID=914234 RepID=M2R9C7_CERS8|nr:hypothetical protein CERSUDRAFT_85364 [Gelatoporia subvermispora B]